MKHLLVLSLGPVQDFIAAARRTSDLSAGSELLVEIAKATAKAVEAKGGKLIFPADSDSDGPNKILAELPEDVCPKDVAEAAKAATEAAKAAAQAALAQKWAEAKRKILSDKTTRYSLNADLADKQIEAFLEVYAAWAEIEEGGDGYKNARKTADKRLAARKNLRDFMPLEQKVAPPNIYAKSPLDPAWECALTEMPSKEDAGLLKLRGTEFLDGISLMKRATKTEASKQSKDGIPSTRDMARRHSERGALGTSSEVEKEDSETPEPYPYFAILVADGDRMGKLLDGMDKPLDGIDAAAKHQDFSKALARFAKDDVDRIVKAHDGYKVYAGGDDVLALLPAKEAVACARELAAAFDAALKTFRDEWKRLAKPEERDLPVGTLSAGVAIVHYRQPLSISLEMARAAEKAAKNAGRDSLALALHTRGGVPLTVTQKWKDWKSFDTWLTAFREGNLTRGVAYELRALADEFDGMPEMPDSLLDLETQRIWGRKKPGEGKVMPDFPGVAGVAELRAFANLLIAARFLTEKGENTDGQNAG